MLNELDNFIINRLKQIKLDGNSITVYGYEPERELQEAVFPSISVYRVDFIIRNDSIRAGHEYFEKDNSIVEAVNTVPVRIILKKPLFVLSEGCFVKISGVIGNTVANGEWLVKNISPDYKSFDIFHIEDETPVIGNGDYISGGVLEIGKKEKDNIVYGTINYRRKPFPTPINVYYEIALNCSLKSQADRLQELIHQMFPAGYQTRIPGCMGIATFILLQVFRRDELVKPLYKFVYQYVVDGLWIERLEKYKVAPIISSSLELGAE